MSNSNKKVYLHSFDVAEKNGEIEKYHESGRLNGDCAKAVEKAITDSNYELYHYDLKTAAKKVITEYGSERVNMVLANTLQYKDCDGRFSRDNKEWAKTIPLPDIEHNRRSYFIADTHPAILDGFINHVRREQTRKPSITGQLKEAATRQKNAPKKDVPKKDTGLEL